jgi:hypothetical protein
LSHNREPYEISGFTGEVVLNSVVIGEYKKFHGQTRASAA